MQVLCLSLALGCTIRACVHVGGNFPKGTSVITGNRSYIRRGAQALHPSAPQLPAGVLRLANLSINHSVQFNSISLLTPSRAVEKHPEHRLMHTSEKQRYNKQLKNTHQPLSSLPFSPLTHGIQTTDHCIVPFNECALLAMHTTIISHAYYFSSV